jgi:hypothetical protein
MADTFRKTYRPLSNDEKLSLDWIKIAAENMLANLEAHCRAPRELALAKTKLEESVMWAVKGITG